VNSITFFETDGAARHLAALCAHFGRKVEAECAINKGWVQFPFGRCEMSADDQKLELFASAADPIRLDKVVQIVTSHLERFAFRENPTLLWRTPSKGPKSFAPNHP
jgi:hypothetical protein